MRRLEDHKLIKLLPGEKMHCVQRQHLVALLFPFSLHLLIIVTTLVFIFLGLPYRSLFQISSGVLFLFALVVSSFLSVWGTFVFMNWYYQFYIVTTRRIIHIHFFHIGGFRIEEVFLDETPEAEVDCNASNLLYDFLGLEDVYVYFPRVIRPEPFVFRLPQRPEIIEDFLENLTREKGGKDGPPVLN